MSQNDMEFRLKIGNEEKIHSFGDNYYKSYSHMKSNSYQLCDKTSTPLDLFSLIGSPLGSVLSNSTLNECQLSRNSFQSLPESSSGHSSKCSEVSSMQSIISGLSLTSYQSMLSYYSVMSPQYSWLLPKTPECDTTVRSKLSHPKEYYIGFNKRTEKDSNLLVQANGNKPESPNSWTPFEEYDSKVRSPGTQSDERFNELIQSGSVDPSLNGLSTQVNREPVSESQSEELSDIFNPIEYSFDMSTEESIDRKSEDICPQIKSKELEKYNKFPNNWRKKSINESEYSLTMSSSIGTTYEDSDFISDLDTDLESSRLDSDVNQKSVTNKLNVFSNSSSPQEIESQSFTLLAIKSDYENSESNCSESYSESDYTPLSVSTTQSF